MAAPRAGGALRPSRAAWPALALFALVAVVFALTASRDDVSRDVSTANFASWHLATTGSPWVDDVEVPGMAGNPQARTWVQEAPNGHTVVSRSPGVVAAGVPAYALLGAGEFTLLPGALTAATLAAAAVVLLYLALRTRLRPPVALLACAAFAFSTPVWTVAADGLWPHSLTVPGICGMAWAAATRRWWLVGAFGGLALWGRLHVAVVVALVGLLQGRRAGSARPVVQVAVPSLLLLLAECAWSRWVHGSWSPMAAYGGGESVSLFAQHALDPTNQLGLWVSPDRGVLVWTPALLLLLPALVREWGALPAWSRHLLAAGVAYTALQGALITFTGGDTFYGYRLGLEALACAVPAYAFSVHRAGRPARALLGPVLAVQTAAMALGAAFPSLWLEEGRAWHDNAFAHAMSQAGPAGALIVAAAAVTGVLLARLANRVVLDVSGASGRSLSAEHPRQPVVTAGP